VYFFEKIVHEHSFPFWTEKLYSGFPVYADPENAYLNPVNDASILIFGPWLSYRVLHLLEYLVGSLSLYFLLKRKGIGIAGYAAANAIFFFNTFFIDHQIHFNMIMSLYLIPTAFLFADMFIEKRRLLFILLESLVIANAVLWGHIQSAVFVCMGIFVYMAIFSFRKMRFSVFLFFFLALALLVTVETLPQTMPTYDLFSHSKRTASLDYLKGSLNPRMAVFSFVPYLLGGYQDFVGRQINRDITYNEVYTYFGISSMLLSALALFLLKKSREVVFAFALVWIFLIFGFMAHNKIFPESTPLVTLFREWGRTAVLSSFGIALLAGIFVEKIGKASFKNARSGILFLLLPLVYIWILIKMDDGGIGRKLGSYVSFDYIRTYPYFPALKTIVLVLAGVLLLFFAAKKWYPGYADKILRPIKIVLVLVVLFDLVYFSQDVLAFRLQDVSRLKMDSVPAELENKRVILNSPAVWGMESLYYKSWSPLGSSQLKDKEYADYFGKSGIDLTRGVFPPEKHRPTNYPQLKEAGIVAIFTDNKITYLNDSQLDVLKGSAAGHYVEKREGRITMQIDNQDNSRMNTFLRYDPNWIVKIDGQEAKTTKDGLFFGFPLEKGSHLVEIRYSPKPFYEAVAISLASGIAIGLFLRFRGRKLKNWLLENNQPLAG